MEIKGQDKFLLSDTAVPDIFIHEYMPRLDGAAVKCYLLLLSAFQNGKREISKKDLSLRLSLTPKDLDLSLNKLVEEGLIILSSEGIKLSDMKAIELRTLLAAKPEENTVVLSPEVITEREQVVTAINNEYFQGLMTHAWYDMIDDWFAKYRFEPAVVQALFAEATAADKWGKLNRPFLNSIAARWSKHGVKTFSELSVFYEQNELFLGLYKHICKVLRISFTEPGMRMVESWVDELGYDKDVIDLALEETTASSRPNLRYVDTILRRWHSQGIKSKADVENERKSWLQGKKSKSSGKTAKSANRDNYEGEGPDADYDEAFGLTYPKMQTVKSDDEFTANNE
ncbi:MAG TPA: DnaD domain protein [Clostridiaceae bacterium]|nr:DnaD domain protein [Clostridiaceae bacterium]